ncbi:MAG TPA: D-alanine--D-alanine ligase [Nocardioidaceae bacterium]|nr:D-alanine--D-alanine ligase [Nocardioidaceae bacterium]
MSEHPGRVVVLAGGLSHERDVSLRSGRRVADALRAADFEVQQRDFDVDLVPDLQTDPPACVVPVLHGEDGEDGALQEVLALLGIPHVGSPAAACRLAFDKAVAKSIVTNAGLSTPDALALPAETFRELGAASMMDALVRQLGLPLVVKPTRGGSALGVHVVNRREDLPSAMVGCFSYGPIALVERFIRGTEVAVTVVEDDSGARALPIVEIRPDGGVYDYSARYTAGATEFVVPAQLSDAASDASAAAAVAAHRALGLRDLSRSDLIVADDGSVWFIEVNVSPGMTETSLVPLAVEAAGTTLSAVCGDLVRQAIDRKH